MLGEITQEIFGKFLEPIIEGTPLYILGEIFVRNLREILELMFGKIPVDSMDDFLLVFLKKFPKKKSDKTHTYSGWHPGRNFRMNQNKYL